MRKLIASFFSLFFAFFYFVFICGGNVSYAQTPSYTVGGSVSGLASGKSLVLRNNSSSLIISSNGVFTFPAQSQGTSWSVSVGIQPSGQLCSVVSNASGINITANVTNVSVVCVSAYNVSGNVTGLAVSGLVLKLNSASNIIVASGATSFRFSTTLSTGSPYLVSVAIQPAGYKCVVTNGVGTIGASNVNNVSVSCAPGYTVGGAITGLATSGLVLKLNDSASKILQSGSTSFNFTTLLTAGSPYSVTVTSQPIGQYCYLVNNSGSIISSAITTVQVSCLTTYQVSYQFNGLRSGNVSSIKLILTTPNSPANASWPSLPTNGQESVQVTGSGSPINGVFSLRAPLGFGYSLEVTSPYGKRCTAIPASGVIAGSFLVSVNCVDALYITVPVQGAVSIPEGMGTITISNTNSRGTDTCSVSAIGSNVCVFGPYDINELFNIQVSQQPLSLMCSAAAPTAGSLIASITVSVNCTVKQFRVSGFVSGNAEPLVLTNNGGESLIISTEGGYYEFSLQDYLSAWNVQITSSTNGQRCYVFNHAGTLISNYTNVNVNCTDAYIVGGTLSGLASGSSITLRKTVTHAAQSIFYTEAGAELSAVGSVSDSPGGLGTVGWGFSLNQNMTLTHLGAWIGGSLYGDVVVGLWNSAGSLLASTTLAESNFAALQVEGDFGYMSLANNVNLFAGDQYTLGAYYTGGIVTAYSVVVSPINGLSYISPSLANIDSSGLAKPTETFSPILQLGFFGPNLRMTAPEYGNEVESITISSNGAFTFPTGVADGDNYLIEVVSPPVGQICVVNNPNGTVNLGDVYLSVTCQSSYSGIGSSFSNPAVSAEQILIQYPAAPSGNYWFDPDGAGGQSPFQAYADMTTNGGGWILVRHVAGTGGWYPENDALVGANTYGEGFAGGPSSANSWGGKFDYFVDGNTEYLFAVGDYAAWCVIKRGSNNFNGVTNEYAVATPVIASYGTSIQAGGLTNVLMRSEFSEDPQIGCEGNHWNNGYLLDSQNVVGKMLYVEAGAISKPVQYQPDQYVAYKNIHSGINIFVRKLSGNGGVPPSPAMPMPTVSGVTHTVGQSGSGAQFTSLAAAVAAASSGDTIQVFSGNYVGEYITINKDLTIVGVAHPTITYYGGVGPYIQLSGDNVNVSIQGISFIGEGVNTSIFGDNQYGNSYPGINQVTHLKDVQVSNTGGAAIFTIKNTAKYDIQGGLYSAGLLFNAKQISITPYNGIGTLFSLQVLGCCGVTTYPVLIDSYPTYVTISGATFNNTSGVMGGIYLYKGVENFLLTNNQFNLSANHINFLGYQDLTTLVDSTYDYFSVSSSGLVSQLSP